MNFATWSIRNPIPSILLFFLLSIAGIYGFSKIAVQDLPDVALPAVSIVAVLPGATPSQLETEVARRLEDAVAAIDGLQHMSTAVNEGVVQINASFSLETALSDAQIRTKDAVDSIRSNLPPDLLAPVITSVNFTLEPILVVAIESSRMDEVELSWFVDDMIGKRVRSVPGVGKFERVGGVRREVDIVVDPVKLAAVGATASDVSSAIRRAQQQSSGGRGQLGAAEQSIRTVAIVPEASELASLPIVLADGRRVRLDQVATVRDGAADPTEAALLDGRSVVAFQIFRSKGASEVGVADGVREKLEELRKATPGLTFTQVGGSVDYTVEQYEGSMAMLYEGAILSILVVWLFLRDWRATLIAATALPLSILPTFAAMQYFGFTLNTLTLLAMAVVVGILVDDAIVEIENIERHRRMGKPILAATEEAVDEIAKAVIATTLSLVVVFLPTAMMSGFAGLFFRPFGWTAVIAVLASLLVARLLTPMMAAYFLKDNLHPEPAEGPVMQRYLAAIHWTLDHPKTTLAATMAFLAGSLALLPLIPSGFLPADDRSLTEMSIELPPGTALATTKSVAEEVRVALQDVEGMKNIFTAIGQGDQEAVGEVRTAQMSLTLDERGARPTKSEIEGVVRDRLRGIPGARFNVGDFGSENLELNLAGEDSAALQQTAQALERGMRGIGTLANIKSSASLERQEIVIRPDLQRAAELGVTAQEIGDVVRVATNGDFDAKVARLNLDNRQVFIKTRIAGEARSDLSILANLRVRGRDGLIPLGSVATISVESGLSQINRYDRSRVITVSADLGGMAVGDALTRIDALPAIQSMPSSVSLIPDGSAEIGEELAIGFVAALAAGVLCIYAVLVLLFKDFFQPVTILFALPLSIGGAFIALLLSGNALVMPAMIGLVMLMGIVAKNSILLVEYAILGITERGLSRYDALIDACRKRARPIIMTTVAMIAGMVPIAFGFGADASFRRPMATAVIGGLLMSTLLSLLVVPVIFSFVDDAKQRVRGLFRRKGRMHHG
ncbi:MAG: efflux RND transporter permease subunit [Sphingopyxis sp.]|nr:efflux RND transporter permease subunit [Sphingopyxis sp.]